ncbi:transposable element Tc1 transposase [Trichonephila clavipes]|nr:transposable element Tc1 transposase [Trichonephila clavipes]
MSSRNIRALSSNCQSFKEVASFGMKDAGSANWRIARHMGRSDAVIRRLEDAGKNGLIIENSSVMMVAVELGPQQIVKSDQLSQLLIHLPITPTYCRARLQRCLARSSWNHTDYTNLQSEGMVWGAISFDSRTLFSIIRDTLTAQRYVDDILRNVLRYTHRSSYFQQDNSTPHTVRVTMNCLISSQTLPWPARLPEISPNEHVWDMIRRQLHLPWNVDDLNRKLVQI